MIEVLEAAIWFVLFGVSILIVGGVAFILAVRSNDKDDRK